MQSIVRAFDVLETLAEHGPMTLSALASSSGLPLTTVHRLVGTLGSLGYVRPDASKRYALAPRLIHLGERSSRMLSRWAVPHLTRLVDELGETANLAMLDGDTIVYVAQVPSRHSMRMFTEVGRRVLPHATAVGKALLAQLPDTELAVAVGRTGLPAITPHTLVTLAALRAELERVREDGFATDEEEQELGVRCVAAALPEGLPPLAFSVSGPVPRMTAELMDRAVPALRVAASGFAADLAAPAGAGTDQ